ncbi:MAG: hypothetical protein MZV64_39665 [Ignavibacteriales bacterium]|nr:hypothetical protein [Ignavibacteriales bacterium]
MLSNFNYDNNKLNIDVRVIDSTENYTSPAMLITGYIPISLTPVKDSIDVSDEQIDLTIESDEFDLGSLQNSMPYVQFQKGKLETDIFISGTISKPIAIGYFSINDARLKVTNNNLDYDLNTKIWIDDEDITIESIDSSKCVWNKTGRHIKW